MPSSTNARTIAGGKLSSLRKRRNPLEQPTSKVDAHDRAALVAGEEATLPLQTALGNDLLISVAGEQADGSRRVVGRHLAIRCCTHLRFDPDLERQVHFIECDDERHDVNVVPPDDL